MVERDRRWSDQIRFWRLRRDSFRDRPAFGNVPIIKKNFSLVALGIVAVSLLPVLIEWLKHKKKGQRG